MKLGKQTALTLLFLYHKKDGETMPVMYQKEGKFLQERDIDILKGLYQHRALTTSQIREKYDTKQWYTYKKLKTLENARLIIKERISGYTNTRRNQGNYYRISETGIACLRKQGYPVERKAYDLRVSKLHLPFLLSANEIMIHLERYGWQFKDSRYIKGSHNLNRSSNVQGALISPHHDMYVIYTVLHEISDKNLEKIAREIEDHDFDNYILFAKSSSSFTEIVERYSSQKTVINCSSLKIFPYSYGKKYLSKYPNEESIKQFLETHPEHNLTFKTHFKSSKKQDGLNVVVQQNGGEEKYYVNLLDTDLMKVYNMLQYRKEEYEREGRKLLVITNPQLYPIHKHILRNIQHIDFLVINTNELIAEQN